MSMIEDARNVVGFIWEHPGNQGQRTRALARAVCFQARGRVLRRRTLARLGERSRMWADLHRSAASKAVYANPPDYREMLVWRRHLRPGDLFLDVGANVGSYSIWAGELGAEVIALEPAADTFALLEENAAMNGYPVRALRAAAGAHCGTTRMTSGLDSVNRLDPAGAVGVRMVTIDSVVQDRMVAGMKVDVEGFEIDVLRGSEQALAQRRIQLIQLEWNTESLSATGADRGPVAALLGSYGYRLYRPDLEGTLLPAANPGFGHDVFACPEDTCGA